MTASVARRLTAVLLIALMAIGSVLLWLGIPVGVLYAASRIAKSSHPSMGIYVMILIGIPALMVIVGKGLSALSRVYADVTGTAHTERVTLPWHRSMRGERDAGHRTTVLDVVMVLSVGLALLAFGAWFFLVAGSSLPT